MLDEMFVLKEKYGKSSFDRSSHVGHRSAGLNPDVGWYHRATPLWKDPDNNVRIHPDDWRAAVSECCWDPEPATVVSPQPGAPVNIETDSHCSLLSEDQEWAISSHMISQFSGLKPTHVAADKYVCLLF